MPLWELHGWPGPLTHRQFKAWQAWRLLDMNEVRREDAYAMQIAAEVRRIPAAIMGKKDKVQLDHFRLKFEPAKVKQSAPQSPPESPPSTTAAMLRSQAAWLRAVGVRPRKG